VSPLDPVETAPSRSVTAGVRIRAAVPADVEALLSLMQALYLEDGTKPLETAAARRALEELLATPQLGRVWVAADGEQAGARIGADAGAPVAYVVLTLGYSLEWHGRDAFIDEVYVAPGWRGRGVGRALLDLAEREARAMGVRAVHLEVEPGNARARAVYEQAGYEDNRRRLATKRL
jgi:ribosomal protein S18 acetylase RimI-like enzyme